jgi:hypothetical protein
MFDHRFEHKKLAKFMFSRLGQTAEAGVDHLFDRLPLKISNATNYENCVPQKDEQLLYWPILKCLSENWRTRQKF